MRVDTTWRVRGLSKQIFRRVKGILIGVMIITYTSTR